MQKEVETSRKGDKIMHTLLTGLGTLTPLMLTTAK